MIQTHRSRHSWNRLALPRIAALLLVSVAAGHAAADEAFYRIPLADLKLENGQWPNQFDNTDEVNWQRIAAMTPWVRLEDAQSEAYLQHPSGGGWDPSAWAKSRPAGYAIVVRSPAGKAPAGLLVVPANHFSGMTPLRFTAANVAADPAMKDVFYRLKYDHYQSLRLRGLPGAAWFRHQALSAQAKLSNAATRDADFDRFQFAAGSSSLDDTYNLFAGGRALSENLQLDRVLPAGRQVQQPTIRIDEIAGIKTKELDWKPLIQGKMPATDPLAASIPADQHAIFFPTFAAMRTVTEEADTQGVPVIQALEPQATDARVKDRYQRQLCLPMTIVGRLFGPQLIDSIAITGSDAYLRVGSDVAVLFQAKDAASLKAALTAQQTMAQQREAGAEAVQGKVGTISYSGVRTPDRALCSYLAQLGDSKVIVVTNSLKQLERLVAVHEAKLKPISESPEYTFFRDRYARGGAESAFIVLTDATIRRWCSPRWRILDSRRTLAAAVMAELQAENLGDMMAAKIEAGPLSTQRHVVDLGELRMTKMGVVSSTYGSLDFMTPILELTAEKATQEEAQLYGRWRGGYEQNWSTFFDPIAVSLSVSNAKLAADITVMPLIAGSQYNEMIELTKGVKLAAGSGDPHDALLHFAMAMNRESKPMKQLADLMRGEAPQALADPLAWVGKTAAIYVDDDPLWQEAAKAADPERFLQENFHRLPVVLYVANDSPLRLAAFLAAVRAYANNTAPDMAVWETLQHNGHSYVRVSGKGAGAIEKVKIYYATTSEALMVTLNETVLQRAMDRADIRAKAATRPAAAPATTQPATQPWLGESASLQIDGRALTVLRGVFGRSYQQQMQQLSWSNLPILNEWKRLYPNEDPVRLHQRFWQIRLVDPAGGQYAWNEQYQTMESTTYGHPGAPKAGPGLPAQLEKVIRAGMGVTFENQGLRARAVLEREAK